ncbi:MAG: hypothetical protein E6J80_02885, partial [Deltaproteobacteria bacterium]
MNGFVHRYRVVLSCGFFLVLSLFLAAVNSRAPYRVDPVGVLLLEVMHPFQLGATALSQRAERLWDGYLALWSLRQENVELRRRLETLQGVSQRAVELDLANRRLGKLLALRDELGV